MAMHYYKRSESTNGEASFVTNRELRPGGRPDRPACAQDADLVARFGPQLCQNAIQAKFNTFDDCVIEMRGLQNFLQPNFSIPLTYTFRTFGRLAMTYEQVQSVCITKCQKDSNCVAVEIVENFPDVTRERFTYSGKSHWRCVMVNPALGPGAYLKSYSPEQLALLGDAAVTFVKKSGPSLTSFKDIACNFNVTQAAVCQFSGERDGCETLLTADYVKYVEPAIDCVSDQGGNVFGCLACLTSEELQLEDVCPINDTDDTTIFRNLARCGGVCFRDPCESNMTLALYVQWVLFLLLLPVLVVIHS